jgi:hypothetical protein
VLTLEDAKRVISAAEEKAEEIGQPMDIAVVDAGGNLKAHVRMDGAFIGSINISINKAYTAIAFQTETKDLVSLTQSGQPLFGLSDDAGGRRGHTLEARRGDRGRRRREHRHRRAGPGGRRGRSGGLLAAGRRTAGRARYVVARVRPRRE